MITKKCRRKWKKEGEEVQKQEEAKKDTEKRQRAQIEDEQEQEKRRGRVTASTIVKEKDVYLEGEKSVQE